MCRFIFLYSYLAAVRHTAGYSWANNNANYFLTFHEGKEIGKQ